MPLAHPARPIPAATGPGAGPNPSSVHWLIGESFHRAACNPELLTLASLMATLRSAPPPADSPLRLRPGLGVDVSTWEQLGEEVAKAGHPVRLEGEPPRPVARHLVLKQNPANVVIADAHFDRNGFGAELVVPNQTELLLDHTADQQHVPGMVLIEAAIQLVTWAVTHHQPAPPHLPSRYGVMHGCDFSFRRFVFPVPAQLTATFTPTGPPEPEKIPLRADVTVHQAGRVCSRLTLHLHAFYPEHVFDVESHQAVTTLRLLHEQAVTGRLT
ncbi:AfsA-related hotdog domain-containing protein [Streptomyces sp. NPDC087440]|uniref:AfsA-related hotdog domain-containing protein n=1 Tax=Streptomyces sp. NPDC087440 TaxID=3365790 RepID=UPI00381530A1